MSVALCVSHRCIDGWCKRQHCVVDICIRRRKLAAPSLWASALVRSVQAASSHDDTDDDGLGDGERDDGRRWSQFECGDQADRCHWWVAQRAAAAVRTTAAARRSLAVVRRLAQTGGSVSTDTRAAEDTSANSGTFEAGSDGSRKRRRERKCLIGEWRQHTATTGSVAVGDGNAAGPIGAEATVSAGSTT